MLAHDLNAKKYYSPELWVRSFLEIDLTIDCVNIQQYWNLIVNPVIKIVDCIVPIIEFSNELVSKKIPLPHIKRKLNRKNPVRYCFRGSNIFMIHSHSHHSATGK